MAEDDLLTVQEVAALLRRPVNTIRTWRYQRSGPPSFRLGRRVMYRRGDVEEWVSIQRDVGLRRDA